MIIDQYGITLDQDDEFIEWIKLCNFEKPAEKLFISLPNIWVRFINNGDKKHLVKFCNQFLNLLEKNEIRSVPDTLLYYISDCFVLIEDFENALRFHPLPPIGKRSSLSTERILSLKLVCNKPLDGREIFTLYGPKVTKFGKQYLKETLSEVEAIISALNDDDRKNYIRRWAENSDKYQYAVGIGHVLGYYLTKFSRIFLYSFSKSSEVEKFIQSITREAENRVREKHGLPKVGEGWIQETLLYYKIKYAFPELEIQFHARPGWLKGQHLDIFIPQLSIAIEYQGVQHNEPVTYFGGREAFEKTKQRDTIKYIRCKRHGIHLIYVYPDYKFEEVLEEISSNLSK